MKGEIKPVMAVVMIVMLVPGWLYASGNFPYLFPQNECVIRAINDSFSDLAEITFQKSHWAFEKLRNAGLEVPYTYNERLMGITEIRNQVLRICNKIIMDNKRR